MHRLLQHVVAQQQAADQLDLAHTSRPISVAAPPGIVAFFDLQFLTCQGTVGVDHSECTVALLPPLQTRVVSALLDVVEEGVVALVVEAETSS